MRLCPIIVPVIFVGFFMMCTSAHADLCRVNGAGLGNMGITECTSIPAGWTECESFGGQKVWCAPSTLERSKPSSHKNKNTAVLVSVGVGFAVAAVAWYFFKKKPSKNNPGQVELATF